MIPDSIVHLLQTGVSVMVGTRDASLMPECTRAWGIQVGADRESVTVFLSEAIGGKTLENLLKGQVRSIKPATSANREMSRRWHREFRAELSAIGVPSTLSEAWIIEPTVAVQISVSDVFDQTPGPGAGRKIGQ
jgi:hypothetical protein